MTIEEAHERAVDQLVDEILARLHELRQLLTAEHLGVWAGCEVRSAATQVIARLTTRASSYRTGRAVVAALWGSDDLRRVPAAWWETPLGRLLLASVRTDNDPHDPRAPRQNTRTTVREPIPTAGLIRPVGVMWA